MQLVLPLMQYAVHVVCVLYTYKTDQEKWFVPLSTMRDTVLPQWSSAWEQFRSELPLLHSMGKGPIIIQGVYIIS